MKSIMMPLCALAAIACAPTLVAQEMGETIDLTTADEPAAEEVAPAAEGAAPAAEEAPAAAEAPLSVADLSTNDDGPAIAEQVQQEEPAEFIGPKDANEKMVNWLASNGLAEGYSDERGTFIQIGVARDNSIDPLDEDFQTKLEMLYREAQLRAKVEISGLVDREVNGRNWKTGLSADDVKAFEAKYAAEINEMNEMKRKVAKLMIELDEAETQALKGVTATDRLNQMVDNVIKKLDRSYDAGQIAEEKVARYNFLKEKYEEAKAAADELEAKKNDMYPSQVVNASIDAAVRIKLHGAIPLHTITSYVGKEVQVAVALAWSPKLEERASSIIARKPLAAAKPTEQRTLQQFLIANKEILPYMVGARQFVDKNGRLYFYGVSAQEIPEDAVEKDECVTFANQMAMQAVVMALFVEGKGVTSASAALAKRKGRGGDVMKALSENMDESTPENFSVSGLGKVYSLEAVSPITQKPIYISVAAVDAALAAKAPSIKRNWDVRATDTVRTLTNLAGERQGAEEAYQGAKNSQKDFERGRQKAKGEINAEVERMRNPPPVKPAQRRQPPPPRAKPAPDKANQGIFDAGAGFSDDF